MSTRDRYDAGTPCWVDIATTDVDAASDFYSGLFGWETVAQFDGDGTRIYVNFTRDGQLVAGMGEQQSEMQGMPPIWSTYVATEDAEAIVARVEAAGGQVMLPPMQVMDQGTMAVFADPTGAVVSLWQADQHHGSQVVNEPNTWAWNELMTRDLDSALPFYADVFGWETDAMELGEIGTYHVVRGGDEGGLGGMMAMPTGVPDMVPNHWGVYFLVEDAEAAAARAIELGGMVASPPQASTIGVRAILHDPQGGSFQILQPNAPDA